MKLGLCEKCGTPTDARYEIKNNCVYLVKFCKDCGRTSSLVTKDARKWRWKRRSSGIPGTFRPFRLFIELQVV